MSVVGHQPPPFFKRGPAPLARLVFFVAVSLTLLVVDLRFRTLEMARLALATVIYPLQRAGYLPVDMLADFGGYFTSVAALQQDNAELRQRQLATANLLLRQEHLELENQRLRALLDMKARQPAEGRVAEILYAARDPFARRVVIDKGQHDGIGSGQAVIDDIGVIGQVTRVFPMTSEVTLLTDKDQAIPVQVLRNGLRAVLAGAGAGSLELRFLAANAEIQEGDMLVTSGLDGIYLPGLPVARVARIERDTAFGFARIVCEPLAGIERHGMVLVLGNRIVAEPPPETDSSEHKDKPVKGRKSRKAER
jgi:rod shape-determining protein MreC